MINITAWAFTLTRLLARNGNTFRVVACYLYTHTQSQKSIVNRRTHVSGYHSSPPTHRTILIRSSSSSSAGNTDLQHSNKSWRFVGHHITRSPTRDRGREIASQRDSVKENQIGWAKERVQNKRKALTKLLLSLLIMFVL